MNIYNLRALLLCLLLIYGSQISFGNQSKIDSCLHAIQATPDQDDLSYARLLYETGNAYIENEDFESSIQYYSQSLQISKRKHYDNLVFHSTLQLGNSFFWQSEYDSSLYYLNVAEDYGQEEYQMTTKDSLRLFKSFGKTYFYIGQIDKSYQYKLATLNISKNQNDSLAIAEDYFEMAQLDKEQGKNEHALEKLSKALPIFLDINKGNSASYCYDLMAWIYLEKGNPQKALDLVNLSCDLDLMNITQYNLGYCPYAKGKIYLEMKEYDLALASLKESLEIRKKSNQKEEIIQTEIVLAELLMLMGKCGKAMRKLQSNLEQSKSINSRRLRKILYKTMYKVSYQCGDYKEAFICQEKYYQLRDSISNENVQKELANMSSIHELEHSKQQLDLLTKEKELSHLHYWIISIACLILLGLISFGFWLLKKQYQYNSVLELHQKTIVAQNKTLSTTNAKLKSANVELENFAYIASHDLKAPLRTIGSYASLLKRRYKEEFDENGKEFLQLITDGVSHMNQLLEDVLAYSNVEKSKEIYEPIDLNPLMDKVLQTLDSTINSKNAKIHCSHLPIVLGNQTQLFQVFQNLIDNGMKFMAEGVQPEIFIHAEKREDYFCIAIRDNGIGIEEKYQSQIFTIFKRLHTVQEYKGTGIGLSICKKIIERHAGEIWLESDGENGTSFYFTLREAKLETSEMLVDAEVEEMNV